MLATTVWKGFSAHHRHDQGLTQREIDVLRLVTEGLSAPAIGKKLYISDRTVEWHIDKAIKKLGARNRIQAVVLAIRDGLLAPHQ